MDQDFITLKDVLENMDAGRKFSINFITCDKNTGMAGELIVIEDVIKNNWHTQTDHNVIKSTQPHPALIKRDPRHYQNSTRNLLLSNGQIRKVHIRLIRKFNGMTVL